MVGCGDFLEGEDTVVLAIEVVMSSIARRCGRVWARMGLVVGVVRVALAINVVRSFIEDMRPSALGR